MAAPAIAARVGQGLSRALTRARQAQRTRRMRGMRGRMRSAQEKTAGMGVFRVWVQVLTYRLLKFCWTNAIESFGLTLIYPVFVHMPLAYFGGGFFGMFGKMGAEWFLTPEQPAKRALRRAKSYPWVPFIGYAEVGICFAIIFLLIYVTIVQLLPLAILGDFMSDPLAFIIKWITFIPCTLLQIAEMIMPSNPIFDFYKWAYSCG